MLAILTLMIVVVGAGASWLLTTQAGLVRAIAMLESLDRVKIRVTGATGRLIGPIEAGLIEIEHPRATIRIEDFAADYEPSEILARRIAAERVRARAVSVRVHQRAGTPKAPAFMPGWLRLAIEDASIGTLSILSPRGTELRLRDAGGSATISRTEIEFSRARADAGAWAVAGAGGRIYARTPLALEATSAWSLAKSREITGVARATGDLDRLLVDARIAVPDSGTASFEVRNLTDELHWRGQARIATLDLGQWLDAPPVGPLRATLSMQGNRRNYAATGVVHGNGLPDTGIEFSGRAQYADRVVTFPELALTMQGSTTLRMQGTVSVEEIPQYDVTGEWSDLRWPLQGRAVLRSTGGRFAARGWREFAYEVSGAFAPTAGPAFAGSAAGQFTTTQMIVERSDWKTLGGRVVASGMLARDAGRAWTATGRATRVDPARLHDAFPGNLSFDFAASGSGLDEGASWSAAVTRLGGKFRGQPAGGGGIVRRDPQNWQFEQVALTLGPARLALEGSWGRQTRLDAELVAGDLSAFLPGLGGRVNGFLSMQEDEIAFAFTGHDLSWQNHRAVIFSADAHLHLEDREPSWLRLRSSGLAIAGLGFTDTRLSLNGLLRDHALAFRVGAGDDAVELQGRGGYTDKRFELQLQSIAASGPRTAPWQLESPAKLSASQDEAGLAPACFIYGSSRACLQGQWHRDGNWSVDADIRSFPLDVLDSKVPGKPRYRGLLFVDASASGRAGAPWLADVRAEIRDAAFQYQSASGATRTVALGRTLLSLESLADRHRLGLRVTDAADIELTAELEATRAPGLAMGDMPVTGTLRGGTSQLSLLPILVPDIDQAAGQLSLDLAVGGRLGAPSLTGQASLVKGSLDFYQANLRLRELRATMRLAETSVDLRASGAAGEGALEVDGRLGWRDRRLNGMLNLKGNRLLLVDVPEARVFASPDLHFRLADRRIDVTGSVAIPQARIVPAETAGAVLPSADETIVRPDAEADATESFQVATDVRLELGEKVQIRAYGLSGRVSGAVRARSAPGAATLASGELEVKEGVYRAYTRELDVERGRLLFTGGPVTDPAVDLRASRKLPGYKVGVIARGRLRRPQLTLFSEPSLPQTQIASLLIVGRSLGGLQGEDRDSLASEQPSLATQGGAALAGQFGRYVGLDDVGLAQESETGTALVLGKYLSPRLYVSYGISLVDEINTLKLRYTIGDRWVISAESGRESAADIEYRIEH
ncbi:MAG: translocation/assembly module TamB domain-containing protein [Steroidobacteraceae bacterium]